jgi:cytidyltransferase-like protein
MSNVTGMRVLVFGTFDLFHDGHRAFLRQARAHGNSLTVVVARDSTVKKLKGMPPIENETERLTNVLRDTNVTDARLGNLPNEPYRVLEEIRPDTICLGYDQRGFADRLPEELEKRGFDIPIIRLTAYKPEKNKSSLIRALPHMKHLTSVVCHPEPSRGIS